MNSIYIGTNDITTAVKLKIPFVSNDKDHPESFELKSGFTDVIGCYESAIDDVLNSIVDFSIQNDIDCLFMNRELQFSRANVLQLKEKLKHHIDSYSIDETSHASIPLIVILESHKIHMDLATVIELKSMILQEMLGYALQHKVVPYFVASSYFYEMAYGIDCLNSDTLEYATFTNYEEYQSYMLDIADTYPVDINSKSTGDIDLLFNKKDCIKVIYQ